jgi:hypothetical protein
VDVAHLSDEKILSSRRQIPRRFRTQYSANHKIVADLTCRRLERYHPDKSRRVMDGGLLNPVNLPPRNLFVRWKIRVEAPLPLLTCVSQCKRTRNQSSGEERGKEEHYCHR